ncbi:MAG: hypothetical protein AAFS13_09770 [Pseudomonadota bacterium]
MKLHDDGGWKIENPEYEDEDSCYCDACGHMATVGAFKSDPEDGEPPYRSNYY